MSAVPQLFGILHRHLAGDEALLRLAQARLARADLGAEVYPATVEEAVAEWRYVPREPARHILHLPRHWDVLVPEDRRQIVAFAQAVAPRVRGLVFHDRRDWPERVDDLFASLRELNRELATVAGRPMLFLEYAAGLEPATFLRLIERTVAFDAISACVDTGHVSIFVAQRWLSARHPNLEAWRLDPNDPSVAELAGDLAEAAAHARAELVELVDDIARLGKPMHFHLHDGHLLSRLSRYQVCDHLPFGQPIPVSRSLASAGTLPTMLGRDGLHDVLAPVHHHLSAADVSLTLEIHPNLALSRQPLGEWASYFAHWTDLGNAELANAWLDQVTTQSALVREIWSELDR